MDLNETPIETSTVTESGNAGDQKNKRNLVFLIIGIVLLMALIVLAVISLFRADLETTSRVRDIFIIFMALQSLVIGIAVVVLIIQLAALINVFKNEIKPMLDTTNETLKNLRGTTSFISNNLVEPVIKMNEYSAGFKKFVDILTPKKKSK
jgi:NADH:ubiquinone oxidoreductase subunit K